MDRDAGGGYPPGKGASYQKVAVAVAAALAGGMPATDHKQAAVQRDHCRAAPAGGGRPPVQAVSSRRAVRPAVTAAVALFASGNPLRGRSREPAWICSPSPDRLQPVRAVARKACQQDDTAARCAAAMLGKGQDEGWSWQPWAGR